MSNFPTGFNVNNFPSGFDVNNFPSTQNVAGKVGLDPSANTVKLDPANSTVTTGDVTSLLALWVGQTVAPNSQWYTPPIDTSKVKTSRVFLFCDTCDNNNVLWVIYGGGERGYQQLDSGIFGSGAARFVTRTFDVPGTAVSAAIFNQDTTNSYKVTVNVYGRSN